MAIAPGPSASVQRKKGAIPCSRVQHTLAAMVDPSPRPAEPGAALRARLADLLGAAPLRFAPVRGGYTPALRWVAELADGSRRFVKVGTTDLTRDALRAEHAVYSRLRARFLPALVAFADDEEAPVLVLEDLSGGVWPPPWDERRVEAVCETLAELHSLDLPLPEYRERHGASQGWDRVAADPAPFLGLGFDARWLEAVLPVLVEQEARAPTAGPTPVHLDVRSDNLCFTDRGAVLVDWNLACRSNGRLDLGFWLPSLEAEGGPPPESVLPDAPEIAAWVSGFFAARAGLPLIPDAPGVRRVQREQLATALPWAIRELELPPTGEG